MGTVSSFSLKLNFLPVCKMSSVYFRWRRGSFCCFCVQYQAGCRLLCSICLAERFFTKQWLLHTMQWAAWTDEAFPFFFFFLGKSVLWGFFLIQIITACHYSESRVSSLWNLFPTFLIFFNSFVWFLNLFFFPVGYCLSFIIQNSFLGI